MSLKPHNPCNLLCQHDILHDECLPCISALATEYFEAWEKECKLTAKLTADIQRIADVVAMVPSITGLQAACVKDHSLIWMAIRDSQDAFRDTVKRLTRDSNKAVGVPQAEPPNALKNALGWALEYLKKFVHITEDGASFIRNTNTELAGFAHKFHEAEHVWAAQPGDDKPEAE